MQVCPPRRRVSVSCCSPNMFEGLGRCHGVRQRPGRAWGPRTAPRPRRDGPSVGPNVPSAPAAPLAAPAERVFSDSWSLARFFWRASRKKASRTDCCCRHHKRGGDPPLREPNSPALPPRPKSEDFDREWTRPRRGTYPPPTQAALDWASDGTDPFHPYQGGPAGRRTLRDLDLGMSSCGRVGPFLAG